MVDKKSAVIVRRMWSLWSCDKERGKRCQVTGCREQGDEQISVTLSELRDGRER